jgi:class 3 adenylate cyclase
MKCPKCQFENPDGAKFCIECGDPMEFHCPKCGVITPITGKYCLECGHKLDEAVEIEKEVTEAKGERKYVTVLFSDMSGYTAMSERLDPEEVKDITSQIFGDISQIVSNYDGFIEKFIGDAVMAVFGATRAYEDDPIRAIKAAREIHKSVQVLSPKYEERIGKSLSMHTGTRRNRQGEGSKPSRPIL